MTSNELNQQTIIFSGQSYKSLPFKGMNRIEAYCDESNGAVAWTNDRYLGDSNQLMVLLLSLLALPIVMHYLTLTFLPSQIIH